MKSALSVAALAALSSFAALPVAASPDTAPTLAPVVVTATRTAQSEADSTAALIVIERDEIERALPGDLAELLRFHAGLDLGRNGGPGAFTSVFTRGGESNHTLVLIDGVRINPASAGGAALQNIAPELIDRIEIVKGPRATLYGSDAIAGVINLITRVPETSGGRVEIRGGDLDTYGASGGFHYGDAQRGVAAQAEHLQSDGIAPCTSSSDERGYARSSVNLQARQRFGAHEARARVWHTQGNAERVDFCGSDQPLDQDFRNEVVELAGTAQLSARWQSTVSASRMVDRIDQQQANFLGEFDHIQTTRPRLDWQNVLTLSDAQRLSVGADWAREAVDSRSFGKTYDIDTDIASAYLQDELRSGRHRALAALSYVDHERFGERLNWNAEYGFQLFAATRLVASAGTGFRAPDADDRFGFGGNPDLDPEEAQNLEVGITQGLGAMQQLELRAFQSEVDDLISVVFDPSNDPNVDFGFSAVNIDRYRNRGVEASWQGRIAQLRWNLSGIAQDPRDHGTDQVLLRRAKRSATLNLVQAIGTHEIGLDVLASGERPNVDAFTGSRVTSGGYTLLHLSGRVQLAPGWSFGARIENLLDKDYETAAGYRQPGIGAYFSLRYSL